MPLLLSLNLLCEDVTSPLSLYVSLLRFFIKLSLIRVILATLTIILSLFSMHSTVLFLKMTGRLFRLLFINSKIPLIHALKFLSLMNFNHILQAAVFTKHDTRRQFERSVLFMVYSFTDKIDNSDSAALSTFDGDYDDDQQYDDFVDRFVIDNLSEAERIVNKIIGYQNTIEQRKLTAAEMKQEPLEHIKRIDTWLNNEIADAQKHIDSLSAMLQPFIAAQIDGKKKRSINLPSGTVGFRKGAITFTLEGEKVDGKSEQLLKFAKYHKLDNFILTKEYVDWANLKKSLNVADNGKVVSSDGEVFDVMTAYQEPDKFYVQPVK